MLPKEALKHVVAREKAHVSTKSHTKKFWKVVEGIYTDYETEQELFSEARLLNLQKAGG